MKYLKKRIVGGLIILAVFLAACQPTPETPPVIYRGEGMPAGSVIDPISEGQIKEIDAPVHWTEEAYCADNLLKINADAEIIVPELSNTPVAELAQKPLLADELERLVAYFAGDSKLLKKPDMTKEELKFQLEQLKARKGEYGNFYHNPGITEAEKRLEKMIETAPDMIEKDYTDIAFTYPRKDLSKSIWAKYDQEEETQRALTDFEAIVETGENLQPEISAVTFNEQTGTSSSFSYRKGAYLDADRIKGYKASLEYARNMEGTKWERDSKATDTCELYCGRLEEIARGDAGTEEQARSTAEKILDELGITHMALASIEKGIALNLPSARWDREAEPGVAQAAYILTYYREAGGVPGFNPFAAASYEALPEQMYRPPFLTERITVVVTKEGLYAFSWESMAEEIQTVAENTKLLPFDAVKERFLEHMGYTVAQYNSYPQDDYLHRYDVYWVELRSFPVAAYNRPDHAWMIPVWVFHMESYLKYNEKDNYCGDDIAMMSALDGGFVSPE
jgi:hypothetical protein